MPGNDSGKTNSARYDTFLASSNTGDPLHDLTVTEVILANTLGKTLELQKDYIQDITDKISALNDLCTSLRDCRPSVQSDDDDTAADATTLGDLGDTEEESKAFIKAIEAAGVTVDDDDLDKTGGDGEPYKVMQGVYDQWLEALQLKSDELSSDAEQKQTAIQIGIGRHGTAVTTGSELTDKRDKIGADVVGNMRT